ncbi:MAG: YkgJ family cysteine cluster protein [Pseudomonadota bacterium]|nr:MAG: YkgJ family cysteine cluster protein [Pseudomonadota bacterium]
MSQSDAKSWTSPVVPVRYEGSHKIRFRCYKGISCFNACCKNADVTLTPYDIVRLKNRLGLRSDAFLRDYAVPFEFEPKGIAGVKLRTLDDSPQCLFMTDEGCSVYEDRPAACRYYPVGLLSLHETGTSGQKDYYAVVKEEHCKGHEEDNELTIDEYREEQGLDEYDAHSLGWRELILKKKSAGPAVGKPSERSLRLFFMTCYNLDDFRGFVLSSGFQQAYVIDDELLDQLKNDEVALLEFGYRFLKQVLFGEMSIAMRDREGAAE